MQGAASLSALLAQSDLWSDVEFPRMCPLRLIQLSMLLIAVVLGCGRGEPHPPQPPAVLPPLTVAEWKSLPLEEKYDDATFERLREADKSLRSDRAWQKFMKDVVVPERKMDIPGVPGNSY
jgi:hypothetical protein